MKKIDTLLKKITNKKLLVVFPHPDDESVMAGGLILRAISLDWTVTVLTITEGGRGKIYVHGKGRSMQEIRRAEEARAMAYLGVSDWVMWNFDDGKLRKTKRWKERLEKFIKIIEPGLMISYDLSGVSGHPDHISLAVEMMRLARKNKIRLIWPSFKKGVSEVDRRVSRYLQRAEYRLEMSLPESYKKWRAVSANKSQRLDRYVGLPWSLAMFKKRVEWFSEMKLKTKYRYRYVKFKM